MKLLILGGTQFVGRHILDAALKSGHEITLFNRGKTQPRLHSTQVKQLIGDRKTDLIALSSDTWDVVIDACGYTQRDVLNTTEALRQRVAHYVFISTISVYADFTRANDESSATGMIEDIDTEVVDGRTYGPLKAECERIVSAAFNDRCTMIRPGVVVGPYDHTERFTYWPVRIARSGEVLAPNRPQDPMQFIDARDLAAFTLRCAELHMQGAYNVIGPTMPIGEVLQACIEVSKSNAQLQWLPAAFLEEQGIKPWQDLPLWMRPDSDARAVALTINARAMSQGLTITPLPDTIRDTLQWHQSRPEAETAIMKAGLSAEREAVLLKAWVSTNKFST